MKKKILSIGLVFILGAMLFVVTGCGESEELKKEESIYQNKMVEQAIDAKKKTEISANRDEIQIEIYDLLNKRKDEKNLDSVMDYIEQKIGKGKELSYGHYFDIKNGKVTIYEDSTMKEELTTGNIDEAGVITWNQL